MNQRNPAMKFIASVVVFTFTVTSLQISPNAFAATGVPAPEVSSWIAGTLAIPADLGQVTDKVFGDPKAPSFVHIQSAHGNFQAEKNIEKLLGYIEKNSSTKLLLLEGAANKLKPELFRLFPEHPDFNRKVTDKLMQEGYLTGPEAYLIGSAKSKAEGWGIENLDAYKKDREAFISVVKKEKTAEKFLGSLRSTIDRRFSSKLNKDLLNLVRQEEAFGSGTVSFAGWLEVLGDASRKHLKLDLSDAFYQDRYPYLIRYFRLQTIGSKIDVEKARVEAAVFFKELEKRGIPKEIVRLFKTQLAARDSGIGKQGQTSGYSVLRRTFDLAFSKLPKNFSMKAWPNWTLYAQHIILMQELDGKGLHDETIRLKGRISAALAKTAEEKEYLSASRHLYLLRRLFALELTRAEYEELRGLSSSNALFGDSRLDARFRGNDMKAICDQAMTFYSTAVIREEHMFTNALDRMKAAKEQRAVIVTGGFHADGLKKLASAKGCSYIQITPRINEVSKRDHEVYLRSILGSRDIETSQMSALLGLVGRAQRIAVTGAAATKEWARDVRDLVSGMINSEDGSARSGLQGAFANSVFVAPAPVLAPVVVRAEVRGKQTTTKAAVVSRSHGLAQSLVLAAVIGLSAVSAKASDAFASNPAVAQSASTSKATTSSVFEGVLPSELEEKFQNAVNDLKKYDRLTRISACKTLGELKDPRAVPELIKLLEDNEVQYVAFIALAKFDDIRAAAALIKGLNHSNQSISDISLKGLITQSAPQARDALISAVLNEHGFSPEARTEALKMLISKKDPRLTTTLIKALALNRNDGISGMAYEELLSRASMKDEETIAALLEAGKNEGFVSLDIARILKSVNDPEIYMRLLKELKEKTSDKDIPKPSFFLYETHSSELQFYYLLYESARFARSAIDDNLSEEERTKAATWKTYEAEEAAKISDAELYASEELNSRNGDVRWAARQVLRSLGKFGFGDELKYQFVNHALRSILWTLASVVGVGLFIVLLRSGGSSNSSNDIDDSNSSDDNDDQGPTGTNWSGITGGILHSFVPFPLLALAYENEASGLVQQLQIAWGVAPVGLVFLTIGYVVHRAWQLHKRLRRFPNAVKMVKDAVAKHAQEIVDQWTWSSEDDESSVSNLSVKILWRNIPDSKLGQIEQFLIERRDPVIQFSPNGQEVQISWKQHGWGMGNKDNVMGPLYVNREGNFHGSIEVTVARSEARESDGDWKAWTGLNLISWPLLISLIWFGNEGFLKAWQAHPIAVIILAMCPVIGILLFWLLHREEKKAARYSRGGEAAYRGEDRDHAYDRAQWEQSNNSEENNNSSRSEARRDPYAEDFATRHMQHFQNTKRPILDAWRQVTTADGSVVDGPYRGIYELIAGVFGVEANSDQERAEEGKKLLAMIYQDAQREKLLATVLVAATDFTFVASSAQRFYPLMPVINNIRENRDLFDSRGLAELMTQGENGRSAHEYLTTAPTLYTGGVRSKVRLRLPFSRDLKLRVLDIGSAPKVHGSMPLNALRSVLGNAAEIHGTDIFFPVLQVQNGKVEERSAYRFGPDHSAEVGGVRYWNALKNPQADFLTDNFDLGKFDIITLAKMLHHVDKPGQDRGPRPLSTRKLVYEKAGQDVGPFQETYLITESQQKAIDRLLGALKVGGVLFLNLTYATWSSRSGPDDLAWRQASRMAVVEKANHDIFIVIQREGEDTFRIYDEVIPFRAENDRVDSLRLGFFDERTVDQWFLGDAPVIKWGRGRKALMRLKENRAEDAGLLAEAVKIFAEADQLAYINQRVNHAIWGQIFKAMEKRDQGGTLPEILDTYLKNVPDSSARIALLIRAGQLESKLISRSEARLTEAQEKQFRKAMRDLKSGWLDWLSADSAFERRQAAAEVLFELNDLRALPALEKFLAIIPKEIVVGEKEGGYTSGGAGDSGHTYATESEPVFGSNPDYERLEAKIEVLRTSAAEKRSEARLTPAPAEGEAPRPDMVGRAQEKQFQKAMSDLKPRWWDGWFNGNGMRRRINAAQILGEMKDLRAVLALIKTLIIRNDALLRTVSAALLQIHDARLIAMERYFEWIKNSKGDYEGLDSHFIEAIQSKLNSNEPVQVDYVEEPAGFATQYYKGTEVREYTQDPHTYMVGSSHDEVKVSKTEFEARIYEGDTSNSGGGWRTDQSVSYFEKQEPTVRPTLTIWTRVQRSTENIEKISRAETRLTPAQEKQFQVAQASAKLRSEFREIMNEYKSVVLWALAVFVVSSIFSAGIYYYEGLTLPFSRGPVDLGAPSGLSWLYLPFFIGLLAAASSGFMLLMFGLLPIVFAAATVLDLATSLAQRLWVWAVENPRGMRIRRMKENVGSALIAGKNGDMRAISILRTALENKNSNIRDKAIAALRELNALAELGKKLNSKYLDVRLAAVAAIGDLKNADFVPEMIAALKDRSISDSAAVALEKIGDARADTALSSYKKMREQEEKERAEREVEEASTVSRSDENDVLDAMGNESRPSSMRSEARLTDAQEKQFQRSWRISIAAKLLLAAVVGMMSGYAKADDTASVATKPAASQPTSQPVSTKTLTKEEEAKFQEALKNLDDKLLRLAAISVLDKTRDPRSVEPLIRVAMADESPIHRFAATDALGRTRDPRAMKFLIEAMTGQYSNPPDYNASMALVEMGAPAVEPLMKALTYRNQETLKSAAESETARFLAAVALGKIGDVRAVDPLIKALKDDARGVRAGAAEALGEIKDSRAILPLMERIKDVNENEIVKKSAQDAIYSIRNAKAAPATTTSGARSEARVLPAEVEKAAGMLFDHVAMPERGEQLPWDWDAKRDVIVVLGNPIPNYPGYVVTALRELKALGADGKVLVVGKGKETDPEWKRISNGMIGKDPSLLGRILIDEKDASMHTGMNIETVANILRREGVTPKYMILIQAPVGLMGSKRIFEHQWAGSKTPRAGDLKKPDAFFTYASPVEIEKVHQLFLNGYAPGTADVLRFNIKDEQDPLRGVLLDILKQAANLPVNGNPVVDIAALRESVDVTPEIIKAVLAVSRYVLFRENEPVVQIFDPRDYNVEFDVVGRAFEERFDGSRFYESRGEFKRVENAIMWDGKRTDFNDPAIAEAKKFPAEFRRENGGNRVANILPNGNLGMNDWFVGIVNGKVYHYRADDLNGSRRYDMLVVTKQGAIKAMRLHFMHRGKRGIFDESGRDVSADIRYGIYGQPVLKDGKLHLAKVAAQFDDQRHLLRIPMFNRKIKDAGEGGKERDHQIHPGFSDHTGQFYAEPGRKTVLDALQGKAVDLDLSSMDHFKMTDLERDMVFASWGYKNVTGEKSDKSSLYLGEYYVSGKTISIRFYPGTHPHSFFGITKKGEFFVGVVPGETNYAGTTLKSLAQKLKDRFNAQSLFLWGNGKDALMQFPDGTTVAPPGAYGKGFSAIMAVKKDATEKTAIEARSEMRTYLTPEVPRVPAMDASLSAKIRTAILVAGKIVSLDLSGSPAYAAEVAPVLFAGTSHFRKITAIPGAFATKWPVLNEIMSRSATASAERMIIDERQGIPDAASVLPLATFALYNPKAVVVLALIADSKEVAAFVKELTALSPNGVLPQNFLVRAYETDNDFVGAFAGIYNEAAPLGRSLALVTDREDSAVTRKIGARRHLLSVVGAQDPLKQTASALLAADKLLNETIWSLGYHFVPVEKLGGLEALMSELTSFVAAQAKVLASA